jgi:Uncharacterised nucleotidyltransferase
MSSSRAERQLILLSAGTDARRRLMHEQAGRLMEQVHWSRLAETLRQRRLLTVLGPRIIELTKAPVDAGFAASVEHAVDAGRRHSAFLQLVSLRIMAMFADADIRSAALKGPLMGEALYGDPGRRLSTDIDLLVSAEQLPAAVEIVRGLGYGAPTDCVSEQGLPQLHFMLVHERRELPAVELHWRVHWYEQIFARERLLPPAVDPRGEWRPNPADQLAALLLFYARDGFVDLRLATDLSGWWDRYGADLRSDEVAELLGAYPALRRVLIAAVDAAEKTVGLPASQVLGNAPNKLGLRERMAVRLTNPNPHSSRAQLYADTGLIDGLLMPAGGFGAFVRRHVLPPPEVLEQQARQAARKRARSSFGRGVGVLARYTVTTARLVRTPERLR